MAIQPGETPEFNFGARITYSARDVSENVIWPLINLLSRRDWQSENLLDQPFSFSDRGMIGKSIYDVLIQATCDPSQIEDVDFVKTSKLRIEEEARGEARKSILKATKIASRVLTESANAEGNESAETIWPEGPNKALVVSKGTTYTFSTDGLFSVDHHRAVDSPTQRLVLPFGGAELDDVNEFRGTLAKHDLKLIEFGCIILEAPKFVMKSIKAVKTRRIDDH